MSLNLKDDNDQILGRRYNVEYTTGSGKMGTFNNKLVNVDGVYFWFSSEEDGLALVKQERVNFMCCTDRPKSKEESIKQNESKNKIKNCTDCKYLGTPSYIDPCASCKVIRR